LLNRNILLIKSGSCVLKLLFKMSQQTAIVQTTSTSSDMTPVLGTLQSVGPNNQTSPVLSNMQNSGTTPTTVQSQTQSQQTQYVSQPPTQVQKQTQQSSTTSSFNDLPQVYDL